MTKGKRGLAGRILAYSMPVALAAGLAGMMLFTTGGGQPLSALARSNCISEPSSCCVSSGSALGIGFSAGVFQSLQNSSCAPPAFPPPAVTEVIPPTGSVAGDQRITVDGENFIFGDTLIFFGSPTNTSDQGLSVRVISTTELRVTTPPGTGTVDVRAVTPGGVSAINRPGDEYTYITGPVDSAFIPLPPARICDTRPADATSYPANGQPATIPNQCNTSGNGAIKAGGTLTIQVAGLGGVPAKGATAAVLNVTAVDPQGAGHLNVYPAGQPVPMASSAQFTPGVTMAHTSIVALNTSGKVAIENVSSGYVNVVVDVQGYFGTTSPGAGLYEPLNPFRVCDTRAYEVANQCSVQDSFNSKGLPTQARILQAGQPLAIKVAGYSYGGERTGVPVTDGVPATGVSAVVLDVIAVDPGARGYIEVYPTPAPGSHASVPVVSTANYVPGTRDFPNMWIVPVGYDGEVNIESFAGHVGAVVDVEGWFTNGSNPQATGALYSALATPSRICDTRPGNPSDLSGAEAQCNGNNDSGETLGPGSTLTIHAAGIAGIPTDASALVADVTVADASTKSWLLSYPTGAAFPLASNLNWVKGVDFANQVITEIGTNGEISFHNLTGDVDVIVDAQGYFGPPTSNDTSSS